uniref:Zgc:112163 n=2 Tax=Seriola lalandi dorsalis TaxID=1841481 RepID=A0A3B4ZA87_SERLL
VIYAAMSTQELFVAAARKSLCTGRKSLSVPQSLDLASQVSAVDLGLKPALLYDSNGASSEQLQQYLSMLQCSQLVSKSLLTLDLNGNTLIVNPVTVRSNIEQAFHDSGVAVIDVCHSLEKPTITDLLRGELKSVIEDLLFLLSRCELNEAEKPLYVGEICEDWNLCTVFGLLLGYPVTYWFNQTKSFENCLSMTPLMVTTAAATWQADTAGHRCCLYSFSVPAVLLKETQSNLEYWGLRLREKFQQQNVLKDLSICQTTVTLPSVCL